MIQKKVSAEDYTQHLQKFCGLKDDEVKLVLANVLKRLKIKKRNIKFIKND